MRAHIELEFQEKEFERQTEAQKKLLEAELFSKLLQIDEEKRKKVHAANLTKIQRTARSITRTMKVFKT